MMEADKKSAVTKENIVDVIESIFEKYGADSYLGEPVTMAEHMLQTAKVAEESGGDKYDIIAGLLHDIGHYIHEFDEDCLAQGQDNFHEEAGGEMLERFFPDTVVDPVRFHVAAKRYLCTVEPSYYDELSEASIHSLNLQGGKMNDDEVAEMESNPNLKRIIFMRRSEEKGKELGKQIHDFAHYKPLIQEIVDEYNN